MAKMKKTPLKDELEKTVKPQTAKVENVEQSAEKAAPKAEAVKQAEVKSTRGTNPPAALESTLAPLPGTVPPPAYIPVPVTPRYKD